jgi:hypothetical protein
MRAAPERVNRIFAFMVDLDSPKTPRGFAGNLRLSESGTDFLQAGLYMQIVKGDS